MRQSWKGILLVGTCLCLVSMLPLACFAQGDRAGERWTETAQLAFLQRHWQTPIPLQGPPPTTYSQLEASLQPESCGVCHPQQYRDWKSTLHARSMGPGVRGQTQAFVGRDPATALLCYSCHAPLAEQAEKLQDQGTFLDNPQFNPDLHRKGLTCAGCHVRNHERYGPPYREGSPAASRPREALPHRGATTSPAFERAEFCRSCHQFGEDGYALNGKFLENTYNEWKAGPYARAGIQCQTCHMPDRRHLWRGIHDPEQVKGGVTIRLTTGKPRYRPGETAEAVLVIENSGVGHYFPTYVTPKVFVRAELLDQRGKAVRNSLEEAVIGREVTLDLSRELYDTRIPPHQRFTFRYHRPIRGKGWRLQVQVTVHPDHFYERFFTSVLEGSTSPEGRTLLQEALERTRRSTFSIFSRKIPIS
ncbi:MAG: multiheme c-type cytochrome [Candidatus Methylomirabilales bacterium]